jgi:hypothetical protein
MTELRHADDGSRYGLLPSPHLLRRTFGSARADAGIGEDKKKPLLNHPVAAPPIDELRRTTEDVGVLAGEGGRRLARRAARSG